MGLATVYRWTVGLAGDAPPIVTRASGLPRVRGVRTRKSKSRTEIHQCFADQIRSDLSAVSYSDVGDQHYAHYVLDKFSEFRCCSTDLHVR